MIFKKKLFKLFTSISLIFSLVVLTQGGEIYAHDNLLDSKKLGPSQVKIIVTNNQTGATKNLNSIDIENNMKVNSIRANNESTDRVVGAHSGTGTGKKLNEKPTSNTFSYTTGWGYNIRVWGNASPRAWSEAMIHVSGMTATYTIKVEFPFS